VIHDVHDIHDDIHDDIDADDMQDENQNIIPGPVKGQGGTYNSSGRQKQLLPLLFSPFPLLTQGLPDAGR
jgi:hypothetical protein